MPTLKFPRQEPIGSPMGNIIRSLFVAAMCAGLAGCAVEEEDPVAAEIALLKQDFPPMADRPPADPTNGVADDAAAARLGQKLFFEQRYSENGQVSCATCHNPGTAYQDDRNNTALGLDFTGRHTPTVLNAAHVVDPETDTNWMFWDGRKDSMWSQALGPPEDAKEMGGSRMGIAFMLYDLYKEEYEAVFGAMPTLRDEDGTALFATEGKPGTDAWDALSAEDQNAFSRVYSNFGKAIAAYERLVVSGNSAYDKWYAEVVDGGAADSSHLSASARRGLSLFIGKAACGTCHNGAAFSDGGFHNTGVEQSGPHLPAEDYGRADGMASMVADEFNCAGEFSDHPNKERCAAAHAEDLEARQGAFKTPPLRNVALSAPYMHTGTLETLAEVVEFYDDGGSDSGFSGEKDEEIVPLNLSESEQADLVAFLESLTGEDVPAELTTEPELPPDP